MGDIVRTWTVYLDQAFELCSRTNKPEILRSYPRHCIRMLGHARVMMNLDATDVQGQTALRRLPNGVLLGLPPPDGGQDARSVHAHRRGATPGDRDLPSSISDEKQVVKTGITQISSARSTV